MRTLQTLGQGGFGTVELVENEFGKRFAKKTFSLNQPGQYTPEMLDNVKRRFIREAKVQSELKHNNIVPVFESSTDSEPPYFIMQLAFSTLGDEISNSRDLNGNYLAALMDIIAALEEIHSLGIYHRDLKPQNVLNLGSNGNNRYAISDFGLMSINDTQLSMITHTGMRMGSDFYTAPEIVADLRRASARSDIYSLGCILHDFVGTSDRIPCNEISDDQSIFSDIIRICTRRDPNRRFQSVVDLREALLEIDLSNEYAQTQEATDFISLIESDSELNLTQWQSLFTYIEKNFKDNDVNLLLAKLSLARVNQILELGTDLSPKFALKYCEWAKSGSFDFSLCDGIANRLAAFYSLDDLTCKTEVLLALLYLGTSHNRWYVERKFMSYVSVNMPEDIAKRFALEIRVLGSNACRMFEHLHHSISIDLSYFHPIINTTLHKLCK
ncbi:serine/threonine-protein kinase [Pseudoalteromonas sp. APC 3218]|uniref:serine/threonine protein kinase n=1 Tax=Pseudoalteromonas sp. APC 3218 TaxID=3035180 RepID=UPI0025B4A4CB|nr:serine/threonine-protein kinase [Pseudoalteromonas sp. APC 3218]MDN3404225.1 serine/threonine-protein kinase [Pseudoalteromonas sp. APC 3218]